LGASGGGVGRGGGAELSVRFLGKKISGHGMIQKQVRNFKRLKEIVESCAVLVPSWAGCPKWESEFTAKPARKQAAR
jgi:hypothetical protein